MTELYTRGVQGAPDSRGDALMQKHYDKLQRAKEEAALAAIRRLQPEVSPAIWALALDECNWDADRASSMIAAFKVARAKEVHAIQQALQALTQRRASDSGSDSDGSDRKNRKRKKDSKEKSKDKKKHKHSKKRSKSEKKPRREKRKERREPTPEPVPERKGFGAYGIISEKDMASKYTEFALWASDVQKMDIEILPKIEEREMFRTFCEDYNTATLPHRKYYDLEAYNQQRAADEAANRGSDDEAAMILNDEAQLRQQQAAERAQERQDRLRDAYLELKHRAPGKAEDMREQEMLRSQMALAYRTGDRDKAAQIAERLKPDEVKEREAAKRMDPDNPGPMP